MTSTDTPDNLRLELYLRGDTYGTFDRQEAILERVRSLSPAEPVEETIVSEWEKRVRATGGSSEALSAFEEFDSWASERGLELAPAFERRTQTTLVSESTYDIVVFPVVCLALYEEDDLRAVLPVHGGDGVVTVEEALDAIEAGELEFLLSRFDVPRVSTGVEIEE